MPFTAKKLSAPTLQQSLSKCLQFSALYATYMYLQCIYSTVMNQSRVSNNANGSLIFFFEALTIHTLSQSHIALEIIRRGFIAAHFLTREPRSLFFERASERRWCSPHQPVSQSVSHSARPRGVWKILLKSDKSKTAGAGLKYKSEICIHFAAANEARARGSRAQTAERVNKSCPFDHRLLRKALSSALTINQHSY